MKILIIRHGDPNYEIDGLTEKGKREAEFLSERISKLDVKNFTFRPSAEQRQQPLILSKR